MLKFTIEKFKIADYAGLFEHLTGLAVAYLSKRKYKQTVTLQIKNLNYKIHRKWVKEKFQ